MRSLIRKLGHAQLTFLVTLIAIVLAQILGYAVISFFDFPYPYPSTPIVILVVTGIVTPIISWHLIKLLFSIDSLEQQMNHLATYDPMTKFLSRQAFFERSLEAHKLYAEAGKTYTVCIIDVDDFKTINDTYGHACGDKVLVEFGRIFHKAFRIPESAGRIGGEEFALMLDMKEAEAMQMMQDLHAAVKASEVYCAGESIGYTVSIGIFENKTPNTFSLDEALSCADHALYRAKVSGKNRSIVY